MKRNLMIAAIVAVAALAAAGATAFAMKGTGKAAVDEDTRPARLEVSDTTRYVPLDKLVVMLRNEGGSRPHYLMMDLAFATSDAKREKQVKEHLPMLRAAAYRTLAERTPADVVRMRPAELAQVLTGEYASVYGSARRMPFDQVLVTKVMMD